MPVIDPTLMTTRKRGVRPGAMVSSDLSYTQSPPRYLTTEYANDVDLHAEYPTALIPTDNQIVINAKGDWNTDTSFRPDFIVITFNLRLDNNGISCANAGVEMAEREYDNPVETVIWCNGRVDVVNADEKTLTPSSSYNTEYSYNIPNHSAKLQIRKNADNKCFVKIPLEWKKNNPNVSDAERQLENIVLDFGAQSQWPDLDGAPISIEDIKFGYYSDEPTYNIFHNENQLIIKDGFLDYSKYATPLTVTNATINEDPTYVLFGDKSISFSGAGEQIRVSYNPLWVAPFRKWYLWVFVYFPKGLEYLNFYSDGSLDSNIVRIDYENSIDVGVKYPLIAWDDDGNGRAGLGTIYESISAGGLPPGWHLIRIDGGGANPSLGVTINPHNDGMEYIAGLNWPGDLKINTIGYDSFTNTSAEVGMKMQSLVFSHSENGWKEEYQNRIYYEHDEANKKFYDPLYEDVVFIVKADGSFEDVTGASIITVEGGLTTQNTIKKFGDAASAGDGWLRVSDRLSVVDNLSVLALGLRDVSIEGWFYHPTLSVITDEALFGADTSFDTAGWSLEIVGDDIVLMVNGLDVMSGPHGMVANTWHKVQFFVNNLQAVVIIDNVVVASLTTGIVLGDWYGEDLAIGARGHLGLKQFTGYFQNIRFTKWSRIGLDLSIFGEEDLPTLKLPTYNKLLNIKGSKNVDGQVVDYGPHRLTVNNLDWASNYNALHGNDSDYGFVSDPDNVLRHLFTGPFTISFLIHRAPNSFGTILSTAYIFQSQVEAARGFLIQMPDDSSIIFKRRDTSLVPEYVTLTGTIPPDDGTFHLCSFIYDGVNLEYYLDYDLDATVPMAPFYDWTDNNLVLFSPNWDSVNGSIGLELGTGGNIKIQNIQIFNNVV